jgi:hypothetical protein
LWGEIQLVACTRQNWSRECNYCTVRVKRAPGEIQLLRFFLTSSMSDGCVRKWKYILEHYSLDELQYEEYTTVFSWSGIVKILLFFCEWCRVLLFCSFVFTHFSFLWYCRRFKSARIFDPISAITVINALTQDWLFMIEAVSRYAFPTSARHNLY